MRNRPLGRSFLPGTRTVELPPIAHPGGMPVPQCRARALDSQAYEPVLARQWATSSRGPTIGESNTKLSSVTVPLTDPFA